jgi:hypothetical protein
VKTLTLSPIDRASQYVEKIPGAVEGNHGDCQTLAVANVLVWDFALSPSEALAILREYNARCSPPWTEVELLRKLQSAEKQSHSKPRGHLLGSEPRRFVGTPLSSPRPLNHSTVDPATAVENWLKGFRCTELDVWQASPIKPPSDWRLAGAWIMPFLYWQDELVNIVSEFATTEKDGKTKANPAGVGLTLPRDEWTSRLSKEQPDTSAGAWIRMNPVDGNSVGEANVTSLRFALIECDGVPLELQLPLLTRLPLPTAAILTSGGRSYHAWIRVDATTLEEYKASVARLLALLVRFGVDQANRNASRLSRLPGVARKIGASGDGRQRLLYLNPKPEQTAIL